MGKALLDCLCMIKMFYLNISYYIIIIQYTISSETQMFAYIPIWYPWPSWATVFCPQSYQRSLEVKRRSTLKNSPGKPIFGMHSHMISLIHIGDSILTTKVIREVTRGPKEVKFEKCTTESMFSIHKHIVFLSNIGYAILIPIIIKGHRRSLEVIKKNTLGKYN